MSARTAGAPAAPAYRPRPRPAGTPGVVELVAEDVVPLTLTGVVIAVAIRAVAAVAVGEGAAGMSDEVGVGRVYIRPGKGVAVWVLEGGGLEGGDGEGV